MHITCQNCKTKFNLPDNMFKAGAKARCSVCQTVFTLPEEDALQPPSVNIDSTDKSMGDSIDDLIGGSTRGGDVSFDLDEPKKKSKKKKSPLKAVLLTLFILLLLGGGGAFGYLYMEGMLPFGADTGASPEQAEKDSVSDHVKHLVLSDIKQYIVENEKVGKVWVIEGQVLNNFDVSKELVKIEATLFDDNNVPLITKQQMCGVKVSLFQLQILGRDELENELNNKVEILTNNTNIAPGGTVDFMVTFYNPPAETAEFSLKIIEAKEPPKNK